MKKFWEKISKEKEKKELFNEKTKLIIGDTQDLNQKLMLINDSENLFVFDDKNIYYDFLKNKFKNIKILNLKELANSVHWNPFTYPYYLYKKGDIDTALELVKKIGFNLFRDDDLNVDLYWIDTISDYFSALTIHLFEKESDINSINMTNILELYNQFKQGLLDEYYNKLDNKSMEYKLISTVLNFPREVKLSILAVFNQKMQMVCFRQMLTERLSSDDIRLDKIDFENQKQCIIVVGKTTYNFIANIFINQLYKVLEKKKPKQKINVILDTLDTISKIEELENLLENDSNLNLNLTAITENKEKLINKYGEHIVSLFEKNIDYKNQSSINFKEDNVYDVQTEFMAKNQTKNSKQINEEIKNNELETLKKEISSMFDSFINPELETYQKQSVDLAIDETRKMYKNVDSKIYEIASSCLKKISQLDEKRFNILYRGLNEIESNIIGTRNDKGILLKPKLDTQDIQIIMKNKYNNLELIKLVFVNKNVLELFSIIHYWLRTDKGYVDDELDYEFFIAIFRKILEITSLADNDNDSKINQITVSYLKKIKELNEEKIELLLKSLKEIKENIETPRDDNGMILSPKLDISDIQNLTYNKLEFKNKNVLELLSFIDFKSQIDRDCINNESIYKLLIKIIREISEITNENIVKQYLHTKLWNVLSDEELDEIFNDIKQKK